ncbi:MAG: hypothetical protein Q8909_20650 [Bacteroidota bacterium]|nr:hypothetical protein [Bacteroidota bacterium]
MKTKLLLLLIIVSLFGCKEAGTINYKLKYTTSTEAFRSASALPDSLYTQFGAYVTSITPYHYSSKIGMLMYQDVWSQADPKCHMISFVDGHDGDPRYETATYADFSGNQEVSVDPILYSTDKWDGIFKQKQVTFIFFTFTPVYLYQEFELPDEYKPLLSLGNSALMNLLGGNSSITYDAAKGKYIVKMNEGPMVSPLFRQFNSGTPGGYIFGNTDSTYIYQYKGVELPETQRFPFWNNLSNSGNPTPLVRCNNFTPMTMTMPDEGQTITMYSTIGFDTHNLIQVYAGADNTPYTNDDVFVYAPKYWNRLRVKLEIK